MVAATTGNAATQAPGRTGAQARGRAAPPEFTAGPHPPEFLATPDCWWPDFGVAAEVDSREWHFTPRDWEQTLARHARMSAQAIVVLHFTPRQIKLDRTTLAGNIRSVLAGRPIPEVRTLPAR